MKRKHARAWTDEELEILRFQWESGQPIKHWAHLLPNRSEKAIQYRGNAMKLPARGNGRTPGNSVTWALIQQVLANGEKLSCLELAAKVGVTRATIYREIRLHRDQLHVAAYGPIPLDGIPPKLWVLGPGKDAKRPAATPKPVRNHRRWLDMKKNDPEAVAKHYAKNRHYWRERSGKLIRRDPAAAWL